MSAQSATYDPTTHAVRPKLALHFLDREANINERPLARHLLSTAKYLGIGALVHAWFLGAVFDTNSAWSWGYLLAWPVPLTLWVLGWVLTWFIYALLLGVVCALLWWVVVEIVEHRARRRTIQDAAAFYRSL